MSRTRIYLPVDTDDLRALHDGASLPPPRAAHAVTSALRASLPGADLEELEYAALLAAAGAARRARGQTAGRRVVVAADVATGTIRPADATEGTGPTDGRSDGGLTAPLGLRDVASFHADEQPGGGDEDLLWFDVSELGALLDWLGPCA